MSKARMIEGHVSGLHSMEGAGKMKTPHNMPVPRKSSPAGRDFAPGKAVDGSTIGGAVDELYHQHPHNWNDLGPHHMGRENEIHEPHPYDGVKPRTMAAGRSPALNRKG